MTQQKTPIALADMVPVTVLTGFLGAGKTTLLKRILTENHGQRIAVIENEFGPENIDNDLLVEVHDEEIIELSNGCVCCTVRGDLMRTLVDLRRRREAGEIQFDRVMIETTGLANPGPVCQTFFMDDDVAEYYRLDGVITVVDAAHAMQTLDERPEARKQVGFADRILVSKKDLITQDQYDALVRRLVRINPRAQIEAVHFGETDIDAVLDMKAFNLDSILEIDPEFLTQTHPDAHHDHDHGHDAEHHHDHDDVSAFVFQSRKAFDPVRLDEFLGGLVQVYGPDLLRYKGILYMKGLNRRMLFQGVHMMMGAEPGKPWGAKEKKATRMVFIGRDLPRDILNKGLEQCLV